MKRLFEGTPAGRLVLPSLVDVAGRPDDVFPPPDLVVASYCRPSSTGKVRTLSRRGKGRSDMFRPVWAGAMGLDRSKEQGVNYNGGGQHWRMPRES